MFRFRPLRGRYGHGLQAAEIDALEAGALRLRANLEAAETERRHGAISVASA